MKRTRCVAAPSDEKAGGGDNRKSKKKGKDFNPYASLQETHFKKDPRANVAPKSGQKSMVYTYSEKYVRILIYEGGYGVGRDAAWCV